MSDPIEEGLALFNDRRYEDAAWMFLSAVPRDWSPRLGADRRTRTALKKAAVAFSRVGDVGRAAALLAAVDERSRAAELLEQVGRTKEAAKLRRGADPVSRPWAEVRGAAPPPSPLVAADRFARAGRADLALQQLLTVEPDQPEYVPAARRAVAVSARAGTLTFEVDHWLGPWVRGAAGGHAAADLQPLYDLARLYTGQAMVESAEACLTAIQAAHPGYRDVQDQLAALWRKDSADDAVLARIAEEERRFHGGRGAVGGFPAPATLPSLPSLPSLPALPGFELDDAPPPGSGPNDETQQLPAFHPAAPPPAPEPAPDLKNLPPGTEVAARYVVQGWLGAGGMGAVYRVRDTMLEETVAMKVFFKESVADLARFKEELKICRRLSHPNVLRTLEFGAWSGAHFLTMELLEGVDLDRAIEELGGPMAPEQGLRLMIQACDGLDAAHQLGIIHRDIKPQNLFVTDSGRVLKIMDFGIAKAETSDAKLTTTGSLVGSPAFLAPERIRGRSDVGPSSDLYSLGVVMYQLFTGALPFGGQNLAAVLMSHLETIPVEPSKLNPRVPTAIDDVVMTLLRKEPDERYSSARATRAALQHALGALR